MALDKTLDLAPRCDSESHHNGRMLYKALCLASNPLETHSVDVQSFHRKIKLAFGATIGILP